ncbi:MAG: HAMP domain-containing protein [Melioribacteraceae bacterium]|nr:HAMP domain-containing protein [Melioribacteraceae bacterium]MCF8396394.1 HAMP domain-containing protein [Melioribacteraceae bacterium]
MNILRIINSSIRYKLIFGFVFISLFVLVVGFIGIRTIGELDKSYETISTKSVPLIHYLDDMTFACLRLISSTTEYAFIQSASKNAPKDEPIEQEANLIQQSCNSCHEAFSKYKHLVNVSFPETLGQTKEIIKGGELLHTVAEEFIEMVKSGAPGTETLEKKKEFEVAEMKFLYTVELANSHLSERLENEKARLDSQILSSHTSIIVFSALALLISLLIGILYSRSITNSLVKLTKKASDLRKGNLDVLMDIKSGDEIGALGKSFNEMAERIKLLISQWEEEVDIIKQKEEEIKEKNVELSKLNAEKDKFFSIIAHDLRSPFNGFIGLTGLMADNSENFSADEFVEHSKSINNSAKRLYKLLENLLEWAQIQKGAIEYSPKNLELSKLVAESIDTIYERALQKGIVIKNEIDDSQIVYADERMIGAVLRNLLSNAVKFTNNNGKISIKTGHTNNGTVKISIEDNGVGIPEENIGKLFKIEEKVSTPGTDGETSIGLGLLLCKEFIELLVCFSQVIFVIHSMVLAKLQQTAVSVCKTAFLYRLITFC